MYFSFSFCAVFLSTRVLMITRPAWLHLVPAYRNTNIFAQFQIIVIIEISRTFFDLYSFFSLRNKGRVQSHSGQLLWDRILDHELYTEWKNDGIFVPVKNDIYAFYQGKVFF